MKRHDRECVATRRRKASIERRTKRTKDRPAALNKPTKHFRLTCWRLLYGVDVQKSLDRQDEVDACQHSRLALDVWDEQKILFPRQWAKVLAKRQRRLDWFTEHGSIKDDWTPPDPKDPRRTSHKPVHALLARHGLTLDAFMAKYHFVPIRPKKGGHKPNWPLIRRIMAWTKDRKTSEQKPE
jgi:hypothetical protein